MNRMVKAKKEEKIKQSIQYKEAFIKLSEYGVKIISQMVPSEPREDIIDEIRKG